MLFSTARDRARSLAAPKSVTFRANWSLSVNPNSFPSTFIIIGLYSPSPSTSAPSSVTRSPPSLKFVFGITIISSIVKVTVSKNSLLCFVYFFFIVYNNKFRIFN